MNKRWKKSVSVMLCVAMILSVSSVTVFADGETTPPATEQTQQETETQKPENGETEETKPETETQPEGEGQDETTPEGETEKPDGVSEAAKSVIAQLEALPKLDDLTEATDTEELKKNVESAKAAFDALTEEEKAGISEELKGNLADLDIFVTNFIVNTPTTIPEEENNIVADQDNIMTLELNGSGTAEDPYQVTTASEFNEKVKADEGTVYIQFADNFSEGGEQLSVPAGKTVVLDLNGQKVELQNTIQVLGKLTLKDSKTGGTLKTEAASAYLIEVGNAETEATLVIENGTYESSYRVIKNKGSVTVNNGTLKVNSVADNTGAIANYGKEKDTVTNHNVECTIKNGMVNGGQFGVALFGKGIENSVDNDAVVLNINGGTISAEGQGIATNASGGAFAGFTVNLTAGEVNGGAGTGMYLPAIGKVNIHGGKVHGDNQGIRIAAGELNITGGTITNNEARNGGDLIGGGSGGTAGAIVAGKAGSGYVGDLVINVSGSATIENQATGENDAIVISDKNMNADAYKNNKIEVSVSGANVNGNVYQTTSTTSSEKDGGNVSLSIDNATITGNVEKTGKGEVSVNNSAVSGNVTGKIDIHNTTVGGTTTDTTGVATVGKETYKTLQEALEAAAKSSTDKVVTLTKDITTGAVKVPAGVTLEGNGKSLTLNTKLESGAFITAENTDNVTIQNLTVNTNGNAKHGIQFYQSKGGKLDNVTINGGYFTSVIVNGSEVTITDCTFNPDDKAYANVEYAMGGGVTDVPSITISGTKGADTNLPLVYMDKDTIDRIKENSDGKLNENSALEDVLNYLKEQGNLNGSDVENLVIEGGTIVVPIPEDLKPVVPPVTPEKPEKPSKPSNGGSSNSGSSNGGSSNSDTTVDKEEEDYNEFWDKVIDRINKADEGDTITVHAGDYEKMPNKVMKALEKNGVGLIIKYNGREIEIPAGEAVNKSNKLFWSFKELGNYVFAVEDNDEQNNDEQDKEQSNGSENNAQSNTTTEQKPSGTVETKPNPDTGSEDYVGLAAALAVTAGVAATVLGKKK